MTPSIRILAGLGSLLLAVGCGSSDNGGQTQSLTSGCSAYPACGSCGTCFEACTCYGQDDSLTCVNKCAGKGNTTPIAGSGGASATGAGGTPTTPMGGASFGGSTPGAGGSGVGVGGAPVGAGGAPVGAGGTGTTPTDGEEYTFQTTPFTVNPGEELYRAQNFKNPFGKNIAIIESESFMSPGSHHMFAFHNNADNADGPIVTSTGIEFDAYIHTAQTPQQLITYPPGIGRALLGTEGVRLQMHYINSTTKAIQAQVSLRVKYVDAALIPTLAGEVFLNNIGLNIGAHKTKDETRSVAMPYDIKLIGAASHMHKHATNFISKTSDGRQIYQTTQWDEPKASAFDPGMDIKAGTSISWTCSWNNDTNNTLTFGEHAETNEMCIFSGLYYPAPNGAPISAQVLF